MADQKKIYVSVDQASAIKKGAAYWGAQEIDLAAVLALLTEDERAHVRVSDYEITRGRERLPSLGVIDRVSSLTVPSTDPADVAAEVRVQIGKRQAALIAQEQLRQERIAEAAERTTAWLAEIAIDPVRACSIDTPDGLPADHPLALEVRKMLDRINPMIDAERIRRRQIRDEAESAANAKRAAEKSQNEKLPAMWVEWAKARGGDLARAADAGYEITIGVLDDAISQLGGEPTVIRAGTDTWDLYFWESRNSPRGAALDLDEEIEKKIKAVSSPDGLVIESQGVVRVTCEPSDEERYDGATEEKFTAVVVLLSSPITSQQVLIYHCE
jgi:hypothetical protein